ncbi:MAG: cytochrome c biogenesis CcdA family protein [Halanaeroarchaeum sp.]
MNETIREHRLVVLAVLAGALAGIGTYGATPLFRGYVSGTMQVIGGLTPLDPYAPGLLLSVGIAFLVGLSMNFLPCNLPIVMSLLPATSDATSWGRFSLRTALYGLGAMTALGTLGFLLGAAGDAIRPLVRSYPAVGIYVAGAAIGLVGLLSILWGLREIGTITLPTPSLPFMDALRTTVDRQTGAREYLLLGAVYGGSSGGCPMPTYHLLLVWVVVAADALFGAALLGTYVVGRVLPVAALGAVFHARPKRVAAIFRERSASVRRINGVVLVALGTLLLVFVILRAIPGVLG